MRGKLWTVGSEGYSLLKGPRPWLLKPEGPVRCEWWSWGVNKVRGGRLRLAGIKPRWSVSIGKIQQCKASSGEAEFPASTISGQLCRALRLTGPTRARDYWL